MAGELLDFEDGTVGISLSANGTSIARFVLSAHVALAVADGRVDMVNVGK